MNDSLVLVPAQSPVGGAGAEAGGGTHDVVECLLQERGRSGRWSPRHRPQSLPAHAAMEGWDVWPRVSLRLALPRLAAATEAVLAAQVGHVGTAPAGERRARPAQTVGNTPAVLEHKLSVSQAAMAPVLPGTLAGGSCCSAAGWRSSAFCGRWSDV